MLQYPGCNSVSLKAFTVYIDLGGKGIMVKIYVGSSLFLRSRHGETGDFLGPASLKPVPTATRENTIRSHKYVRYTLFIFYVLGPA